MDNLTPQLNQDQLRANIDALVKQNAPHDAVQGYIDKYQSDGKGGYVLKGDTQSSYLGNLANEAKAGVSKIGSSISEGADKMAQGANQVATARQSGAGLGSAIQGLGTFAVGAGESALGTASGAVRSIFSPVTAGIESAVQSSKTIAQQAASQDPQLAAIQASTQAQHDDPNNPVQKVKAAINTLATTHPELYKNLSDAINVGSVAVGGEASGITEQGLKDATGKALDVAGNVANKTKAVATDLSTGANDLLGQKPATFNQEAFNTNLNKALPVLKKDVKTLPVKQADARTAFTDIVNNKDSIGITDANGNIKTPSQYTFADTVDAQATRLKQVYQDYTSKLGEADKMKFTSNLKTDVSGLVKNLQTQAEGTLNLANKSALSSKIKELKGLLSKPYIDPLAIQTYIEDLGKEARVGGGQAPTFKNIQAANIGGTLRSVLDNSIEKVGGAGYQDLRNIYKAHKTIESQLLQAAKSELNKTPGWTDRLANLGMTAEGINFLLTHDPAALAIGAGIKFSTKFTKYLNSPQRALSKIFKAIEDTQRPPLIPSEINQSAITKPMNSSISPNPTTPKKKVNSAPVDSPQHDVLKNMLNIAPEAKNYIDSLAQEIADNTGNSLGKAPLKTLESSTRKMIDEEGGVAGNLKDLARNTIVLKNKSSFNDVLGQIKSKADVVRVNMQDLPTGYRGTIINVKAPNGLTSEIQIVEPKILFGKDKGMAEAILGKDEVARIAKETGLEPGLGHTYYEAYRILSPVEQLSAKGRALVKQSFDYYSKLK